MSGASEAAEKLHAAMRDQYGAALQAGRDLATTYKQASEKLDVVEAMAATASIVLALEHLQAQAERAAKDLRLCLNGTMQDIGCHNVSNGDITVSLARKAAFVTVDDEQRIPRHFFKAVEPQLDKKAVKQALQGGVEVPGASLATPNDMTLRIAIRAKE